MLCSSIQPKGDTFRAGWPPRVGLSIQKGYRGKRETISQSDNLNTAFSNRQSPVEVGEGEQIRYEPREKTVQDLKRFELTCGVMRSTRIQQLRWRGAILPACLRLSNLVTQISHSIVTLFESHMTAASWEMQRPKILTAEWMSCQLPRHLWILWQAILPGDDRSVLSYSGIPFFFPTQTGDVEMKKLRCDSHASWHFLGGISTSEEGMATFTNCLLFSVSP